MDTGKLSPSLLNKMVFEKVSRSPFRRKDIILRPGMGEDCAVLHFGDEYCMFSADPITGATADIGYLAVHVNVNDIAACGCEPVGILITLLLPPEVAEEDIERIMDGVMRASNEVGIEVIGGHTEVTAAVNRPVISAAVVGKSRGKRYITTGGALVSQDLVMTKWAGLEGTAIIAKDMAGKLGHFDQAFLVEAARAGTMISVVKEANIAADFGVTAMHDVTEGGILGACFEMAEASKAGVDIFVDDIPLLDVTRTLCNFFDIDPFRLISSGAMLMATFDGARLVKLLQQEGIHAAVIGKVTDGGKICVSRAGNYPLTQPATDELYKIIGAD